MNRTIALLIPAILLAAMALIIFQQFHSSSPDENLVPQSVNSADSSADNLPDASTSNSSFTQPNQASQPNQTSQPNQASQAASTTREPVLKPETAQNTQTSNSQSAQQNTAPDTRDSAASSQNVVQPPTQKPEQSPAVAQTKPEQKPEVKPEQGPEQKPEQKPEPAQTSPGSIHKMESMKFEYQNTDMLLILSADSEFDYKSFQLTSPERLVIDVIGTWNGIESPTVPSNRLINSIRNGKTDKGYRIVLDLKEPPKGYETKRDGNKVTVRVY